MTRTRHRMPKPVRLLAIAASLLTVGGTVIGISVATAHEGEPVDRRNFIDITKVQGVVAEPPAGRNASRGTFTSECGRNENEHRNPDNFIVTPGVRNGAHHTHDYVGNLSTNADSTNGSLSRAGTTCRNGDKSTYFWPVLRQIGNNNARRGGQDSNNARRSDQGGARDGNVGTILTPSLVRLEFRGNPREKVTAMPRFLRTITGDAQAATNGDENARASWTCTDAPEKRTTKYPLCSTGGQVMRVMDFPSCWDGRNVDSQDHRSHLVFPGRNGNCPQGTQAVPQLRMTLTYDVAPRPTFAVDSFPEQEHNPITDHADFANVMPEQLMDRAVACINEGRNCT
ncbi:DUF1996 domain-containing protein [Allokutzneria albata]|uniref:DUF1996 domain-containing protein n=1 Tax=Allokutzneria albata TaxID=211114 RepID=A0A1G9YRA9_ALLAB|nr:DUF1996 domain-containing protein [Allokutzneria albata]SDN11590.1 protein of unknown function [Allokutzneria albata]